MQQTLFEITGVTMAEMIVNTVNFFKQRGWTIKEVTDGDTITRYDLSYKNMIMLLKSSPENSGNIGWYYYDDTHPALTASFALATLNSFIANGLYTMRIRYIENENFIYVEIWSSGVRSPSATKSAFFSFNTKDIMDDSIVNYFGRRNVTEDSNSTGGDFTFKIASELDKNYPSKYNLTTYLKPIATTNSQMLMTENGIPLIDINLNTNKGEILGTKMLMGAIKNKTYKIGEEYWFCFYPDCVALIEEKTLITESEGTA